MLIVQLATGQTGSRVWPGIAIVPSAAARAPTHGANSGRHGKGANDHGRDIPRQCQPAGAVRRGCTNHPHHRPVRSAPGVATGLGRFQGNTEPRHHPLRDLSGARPAARARDLRLCRDPAAVSAGRRLRPARPVCGARSLRIERPPRARRDAIRLRCTRRAAFAVLRRHARPRHSAAGAVRGLDRHRTGDLHRGVRLWRRDQRR